MRWKHVYLESLGVAWGRRRPVAHAIRAGRYTERQARRSGLRSVSISPLAGPELAVAAGKRALTGAPSTVGGPPPVEYLLHSTIYDTGQDFWAPACYVAKELDVEPDIAAEWSNKSASMVSAIQLAGELVDSDRPSRAGRRVLATGGDAFRLPDWDRFVSDTLVYGDCGTALLVGSGPGPIRVLATGSRTVPKLAAVHLGNEPFRPGGRRDRTGPIDVAGRKHDSFETRSPEEFRELHEAGLLHATKEAVSDAGCDLAECHWVLTPFYGHSQLHRQVLNPLGVAEDRTLTRQLGLRVAHTGGGDQVAALYQLMRWRQLRRGHRVALISVGVGFRFSVAICEVVMDP
jgi:3-oxoacyl-[acyl-carrier-protein] synthase-3